MIRTKNRFDRQVAVCQGLKIGFRSLEDILPSVNVQDTAVVRDMIIR